MSIAQQGRQYLLKQLTSVPIPIARALLACNRAGDWAYGRRYVRYRALLAEHRGAFDNAPLLLRAVNRAIAEVPYYRRRYAGVTIASREQFETTFGFIDRDTVRTNPDEFVSDAIDRSAYDVCSTGGTSGRPLQLLAPRDRYVVELATMHSLWDRAGYAHDVRAVIRNQHLGRGELFRINPVTREVIFDGFRLADDDLARVYDVLARHAIRFVHCYPSTAYELASYIERTRRDPSVIRAFLCGSENVFDYQRNLIEGRLGIRFYNWYGHTEKLVLAGHCEQTTDYHVEPTYGFGELVDDLGRAIREPGVVGEIVGTALHNPGMPLIRYRTGDHAEYVADHCDACGRRLLVLRRVRGRWSGDRIFRADGSFVTTTALNLHDELNLVIGGLQYIQDRIGELSVLIVKTQAYTSRHEASLLAHLRERLGTDAAITVTYVERLRRNANGKFHHLISTVGSAS